jgi:ABC-type spermidine/putrescine transport system permease subunit II
MYSYVSQTVTPAIAAVSAIVTAVTLVGAILFAILQARQRRRRSLAIS